MGDSTEDWLLSELLKARAASASGSMASKSNEKHGMFMDLLEKGSWGR